MSIRDSLLNLTCKTQPVYIEELQTDFHVKELSVAEHELLFKEQKKIDRADIALLMICLALCDEQGVRVFNSSEYKKLESLPNPVATKLVTAIQVINGFTEDNAKELQKNSEPT
ncbi:hypothetical protein [Piscirickettsia litoralis]|uniref:Phage tail protein n=1 Tax=Piscirickettsia litoralis TaxID=1891921 RepID=A0ABX3A099_9GAMM|nr:hypothetical protein [Piscirickettsia litoralis]ODN41048.1 hypothetical protein BGC07_18640 [Piscirickettsia litoralis]